MPPTVWGAAAWACTSPTRAASSASTQETKPEEGCTTALGCEFAAYPSHL